MRKRKLKQRIANAFGYDLIRRTKNHDTFEAHFHNLVEKYGVNCVIDVGANRGQYGQKLRELGFKGRICSFEPVAESFSDLQKAAAADPDWRVFRCALGEDEREAEINVFRATVLASFLSPAKALKEMFRSDNNSEIKSKEKVPVKPLSSFWDNVIEDIGVPKVMLKMDPQGYDLKVF